MDVVFWKRKWEKDCNKRPCFLIVENSRLRLIKGISCWQSFDEINFIGELIIYWSIEHSMLNHNHLNFSSVRSKLTMNEFVTLKSSKTTGFSRALKLSDLSRPSAR